MAEFFQNPRRAPRAPIRCDARVALREGGFWAGTTNDYGPRGCQLTAPGQLEAGSRIFVELYNERVEGKCALSGRIAWCRKDTRWHIGVAFDDAAAPTAEGFFARLTAAWPGLEELGRAPERIPAAAALAPARPPHVEPVLLPEEADVLRALGAGATAGALQERFADRWPAALNAIFSLFARRYVVLGAPDPAAADAWAPWLAKREDG